MLMLLRQLSDNLRTQNWTAVWLDLAIVILGIFLGLQVSQWYEGRQELTQEVLVLQRLQTEFEEILAVAKSAIQFHQDEIVALEFVLRSLTDGELNPDDEDQFRSGLRTAMEYDLGPGRSGTYIEILSSGQFRLLRDQELRSALSKYDDFVSKADSLFSNFQQGQRKHESVFGRHIISGPVTEQEFEAMPNGVAYMHGDIAEFDIDAMAKDDEFQSTVRRLIEYHVNYQFWHMRIGRAANQVLNQLDPMKK
jgi:hypothetical protein